jgi:arsenate reductase
MNEEGVLAQMRRAVPAYRCASVTGGDRRRVNVAFAAPATQRSSRRALRTILPCMVTAAVRIYHNPRCSKSREALALLRERDIEPEVVLYLQSELGEGELKELVRKLGVPPHAILRSKEDAYSEAGLSEQSSLGEIVKAIRKAPILLERPIVVVGKRAAIGRPPEKILALL